MTAIYLMYDQMHHTLFFYCSGSLGIRFSFIFVLCFDNALSLTLMHNRSLFEPPWCQHHHGVLHS